MMINKRLIQMTSTSKKYMALNVLYQWISLLCNIVSIVAIGILLQHIMIGVFPTAMLLAIAGIVVVMILLRTFCNMKAAKMSYKASTEIKDVLREKMYRKLLQLGVRYPETMATSEVVQVFVEGVEQLEIYMGRYLPQLFYSLLAPLTLFVVLFPINIKAAIVLLVCVPLIPASIIAVQKFAKKLLAKYWSQYTGLGDHFLENLGGLTTLKIYGADQRQHEKMNEEAETFRKITMKVLTMQLNSISVMDMLAYGGAAIGCIIAMHELGAARIDFWEAFIIIMLAAEFFIPLRLLGSFFHIAMNGMAASDKIFRLLDAKEKLVGEEELGEIKAIELENVNFSYGDKPCLSQVSMKVSKGSFTSLVGPSGCGKSTIAALILGEHSIKEGGLFLEGKSLDEISEEVRMQHITYVNFKSYIFAGTIRDNLLQGNPSASEQAMEEALQLVNLYDFIMSQGGLDMTVSEQGANLSGGQRQRLAIARALLHDSEIYIFDEATSNIDAESEELIMKAILSLKGKKTVLFITHRLAQVIHSDCIYVMKEGKMKEAGTFAELMESKHVFHELYEKQRELEVYVEGGSANA